ncbi:MAG: glutathione S-transferase C-terminal domain-containing protein, partial [Polyangiaceae bacterium]
RLLLPASGKQRRDGLRVAALAAGVADKAVTLLYASLDLMQPSPEWTDRCRGQVLETLGVLNAERAARTSPYWLGDGLSHADVGFACAYRFTRDAHPDLIEPGQFPALTAQADRCEALSEFQRVYLPITNNLEKA